MFPSPDEISFGCRCPDAAIVNKHVTAVLLAIGVRIDTKPLKYLCFL